MLIYRINFWLIEKIKIPTKSVVFAIDGMRQNADIVILKLGYFTPKGWIYVLRPIAACAIPYWLLAWYKT